MQILRSHSSCGLYEMKYIEEGTPEYFNHLMTQVSEMVHGENPDSFNKDKKFESPFLFWSGHCNYYDSRYELLSDFIQDKKLGRITQTRPRYNPNTSNAIKVWIWEPDWPALKAFVKTIPAPKEPEKVEVIKPVGSLQGVFQHVAVIDGSF